MSCVVGYVDRENGRIYIAGDIAAIQIDKLDIRNRNDEKVFMKYGILFGYVGSCRVGQLLRYSFEIPKKPDNMNDMAYLCSIFIKSFIECLKDNDALQIDNGEARVDAELMIAYNGNIYLVASDFQIISEEGDFFSIGSSESYAQGAFYALNYVDSKVDIEKRILAALSASAEYSAGVRGPFKILNIQSETN